MERRTRAPLYGQKLTLPAAVLLSLLGVAACGDDVPTEGIPDPSASSAAWSSSMVTFDIEVTSNGTSVEDAVVALIRVASFSNGGGPIYKSTDSDGLVSFTVSPGDYCVTIRDLGEADPDDGVATAFGTAIAPQDPTGRTLPSPGTGQAVVSNQPPGPSAATGQPVVDFNPLTADNVEDCITSPAFENTYAGQTIDVEVDLDDGEDIDADCEDLTGQLTNCGVWVLEPLTQSPPWRPSGLSNQIGDAVLTSFTNAGTAKGLKSSGGGIQLETLFESGGRPLQAASKANRSVGDDETLFTSLAYCALDEVDEDASDASAGVDFEGPVRHGYNLELNSNTGAREVDQSIGIDYFQIQPNGRSGRHARAQVHMRFKKYGRVLGTLLFDYKVTNGSCEVGRVAGSLKRVLDPMVSCRSEDNGTYFVSIFVDFDDVRGQVKSVEWHVNAVPGNDKIPDHGGFVTTEKPNQCNLLLAPGDGTWWIGVG